MAVAEVLNDLALPDIIQHTYFFFYPFMLMLFGCPARWSVVHFLSVLLSSPSQLISFFFSLYALVPVIGPFVLVIG